MLKSKDLICENLDVNGEGVLLFAGHNTNELANKYATPLYLMDEERIRLNCRRYLSAMKEVFGDKGHVMYASKAASFKRLYEIMREEGMGIDVVSQGEIYTALKADFPLEKAYFHSNNKTDADIAYAIEKGVGYFVVDNEEELFAIDRIAAERGIIQNVLLRITPGIDPHTYEAISTGKVDSKFGSAIETGQAEDITRAALSLSCVKLCGYHCHVGSQVFDSDVYISTAKVMLEFVSNVGKKLGYYAEQLDLGGGYGVRYTHEQPQLDIGESIRELGEYMKKTAKALGIALPEISLEPGRSIVADAGLTLYTVGTVKKIPEYKNYVSVDGGMTDNIRYALYKAPYTILPSSRMNDKRDMTASIVGRCCESGDIIQEGIAMPSDIRRGDIIACLTTGAYHYSMASNYNRLEKPPIVMLTKDGSYIAVKRQTLEDITAQDI